MKNCVSWTKLIQMPTSIGTMWIRSSSRIAGSTMMYGTAFGLTHPRNHAFFGVVPRVGVVPGRSALVAWIVTSAARGCHLVLRLLQRGLHVAVGDGLAGRGLRHQGVDRVADVGLVGRLGGHQRERLGLGRQDGLEGLGLVLVVGELDRAALDDRQRRERLVERLLGRVTGHE